MTHGHPTSTHPARERRRIAGALLGAIGLAVASIGLALAALTAPAAATPSHDGVCEGDHEYPVDGQDVITVPAPDGQLISGYCVKAGSKEHGDGPEYYAVDPPAAEVTISHSSNKDISHYTLTYVDVDEPTSPTTTAPTTPTTTAPTDSTETPSLPPATGPGEEESETDGTQTPTTDEPTLAGPAFPDAPEGPAGDGAAPGDGVPTRIPAGGAGEDADTEAASYDGNAVDQAVVVGLVGTGALLAAAGGVIGALRARARQH